MGVPANQGVLTERDYNLMLEAIRTVGEVTDPVELAQVLAEQVAKVVESDAISVNDVDPEAGVLNFVMRPASFAYPASTHQALQELLGDHPLISHASRTGDGSARKISDFWSKEVWRGSELYRRVYAPMGVEHQMSLALPTPRPAVVGVALSRCRVDFSERDRAALNGIRPHLSQAWRQSREHLQLKGLLDAAASALRASESGVVLLGDPVHELTPGALTELYRFFGRPPSRSALPHRVAQWAAHEREKSAAANVGNIGDIAKPLAATRDGHRLVLRYLPARAGHPAAMLIRRADPADGSAQLALLGLSPRETEVLNLLSSGSTNAEIAARLHVAPSTVKKHLDHVYVKLGVNGRVQAAAVALSVGSSASRPTEVIK